MENKTVLLRFKVDCPTIDKKVGETITMPELKYKALLSQVHPITGKLLDPLVNHTVLIDGPNIRENVPTPIEGASKEKNMGEHFIEYTENSKKPVQKPAEVVKEALEEIIKEPKEEKKTVEKRTYKKRAKKH